MPPKQRGEELKKIIKSVRDGTFEYAVVSQFKIVNEIKESAP
ncbi:MAG: hypothetical protein U9N43_02925 [Euryarchaeota archaeon]|nr:hypothetical protein [Euryarchaeota archaeon]